jgi:hypothetical protein
MFFWFAGTAVASVWFIFRDPLFNYRYLIIGAVLPDVVDIWLGHVGPLHSVVTSVMLLIIAMMASIGSRPRRKRLLAGVIGTFMHLVFDGAFLNTKMFWWPLSGLGFSDASLPSVSRGWWNVLFEIVGVLLCIWTWRRVRVTVSQQFP